MLLYKYVDLGTADTVIKNSTLKFSKASSLNDPFELTSLHCDSDLEHDDQTMKYIVASQSYGILSLTRTPLNPLMWAHYSKGEKVEGGHGISLDHGNCSHAGIVFGIDANEAGLNDVGINVIPAKYGSVIYTSTKPKTPFDNSKSHMFFEGLQFGFSPDLLEVSSKNISLQARILVL